MIIKDVKVSYGIIDKTIEKDTYTITESSVSEFCDTASAFIQSNKTKLASVEKNYFLLDGSFEFPKTGEVYPTGYESANISDENGNIGEFVDYAFGETHSSYGVQLTFQKNCAPKKFNVAFYDEDGEIIDTISEENNTKEVFSAIKVVENWKSVRVTFLEVNPQQRARLSFIVFGINNEWDGDSIIAVSATKTVGLSSDYSDCGEFSFTIFNEFFKIKDIRDLPVGMQDGLTATVDIKKDGSDEYVTFGTYYSNETKVSEEGKIMTISGYDLLYQLGTTTFKKGIVYPNGRSLADWANEVADDCDCEIVVDESLENIISKGYITEVPHREAFRLISEAGNAVFYVDSENILHIEKLSEGGGKQLTEDEIVEDTLSFDNGDKYLGVDVVSYTYSPIKPTAIASELGYSVGVLITPEPQRMEVVYADFPVAIQGVTVDGEVKYPLSVYFGDTEDEGVIRYGETEKETDFMKVTDFEVYADRCIFKIFTTNGDTRSIFITTTGVPYGSSATNTTRGSIARNIKKIENNYLITNGIASDVADYQYDTIVKKYTYTAEILTDKDIDVGKEVSLISDTIVLEKIGFDISKDDTKFSVKGLEK